MYKKERKKKSFQPFEAQLKSYHSGVPLPSPTHGKHSRTSPSPTLFKCVVIPPYSSWTTWAQRPYFIHIFTFNKYLLSSYYVPETVWPWVYSNKQIGKHLPPSPNPLELTILEGETNSYLFPPTQWTSYYIHSIHWMNVGWTVQKHLRQESNTLG